VAERRELPRFALLAQALAARRIAVVGGTGGRAHTDGEAIFVDDDLPEDVLRASVAVQAALLAAGTFEPRVMARLTGRRAVRLRYLTLEAARVRPALPPSVRPRVSALYGGEVPSSPRESLIVALDSRVSVPEAPAWLGTVKPITMLRANPDGPGRAPMPNDQVGSSLPEELRAIDDEEESERSRILELFSGPLANPLADMFRSLLGAGRTPSGESASGGEEMAVGSRSRAPVGASARPVMAPRGAVVELDGTPIGHRYPEWDCWKRRYRLDWCSVAEFDPPEPQFDRPQIVASDPSLRRQLAHLGLSHRRHRRQSQGDSLDLTALVDLVVDRAAGRAGDPRVYERRLRTAHDLGVLILLDTSGSTGESAEGRRVFDQQRELAARLTATLEELGDRVATSGFFSRGREAVRFLRIKDFDGRYDRAAHERLTSLEPGGFTRLGAAIRHGSWLLSSKSGTSKMVLVVIGDAYPYEVDYQDRYAQEDSRQALREAVAQGIGCVCLSVGSSTDEDVIKRVWGEMPHRRLDDPGSLAPHIITLLREATRRAEASRRSIRSAPFGPSLTERRS
jgi:Mg-chelatase subunit ChlD